MGKYSAKIYWIHGRTTLKKTILATKLYDFLKTEKRNWRRDVFYIDNLTMKALYDEFNMSHSNNIRLYQKLIEFIHMNGCDIVVSIDTSNNDIDDKFRHIYSNNLTEILLHDSTYKPPKSAYIEINIEKKSEKVAFSNLITQLRILDKL